MTSWKDLASFHAVAELKQAAQPKNLMPQMQVRKGAHQIVKRANHCILYFFNCQNNHHLGATINFGYISLSPHLQLQK